MNHFCTSSLIRKRIVLHSLVSAPPGASRSISAYFYISQSSNKATKCFLLCVFPFFTLRSSQDASGTDLVESEMSQADFVPSPWQPS